MYGGGTCTALLSTLLFQSLFSSYFLVTVDREGLNEGGSGCGSGKRTTFSCDVSDLCSDQKLRLRGYNSLPLLRGLE